MTNYIPNFQYASVDIQILLRSLAGLRIAKGDISETYSTDELVKLCEENGKGIEARILTRELS